MSQYDNDLKVGDIITEDYSPIKDFFVVTKIERKFLQSPDFNLGAINFYTNQPYQVGDEDESIIYFKRLLRTKDGKLIKSGGEKHRGARYCLPAKEELNRQINHAAKMLKILTKFAENHKIPFKVEDNE